ncbi:MAG: CPBP family intramembrane metalloprotease [Prevotellaceae bacterium]|nr:CPBP family intramembrane metalloprotease [Prevotellaceae bacterium]
MKNPYIKLILELVLFIIVFAVLQAVMMGLTATVTALVEASGSFVATYTACVGQPKVIAISTALSSILTALIFIRVHWTVIDKTFMQSKPWMMLFWAVFCTLGALLPLEAFDEGLNSLCQSWWGTRPFDMPADYMKLFSGLMKEPWGYIAVGVVGPVAEEVVFRGAILRKLLDIWDGNKHWIAIAVSALIFAAVHGNLAQGINAFIIGLLLGWMYWRTRSLIPGLIVHFITNTTSYVIFNLIPAARDGELIDLFHGSTRTLGAAVIFSLFIFLPSIYQLYKGLKRN